METLPVVMTLCAVPVSVKYARVPAAVTATRIASTDTIKSFRFILFAPLKPVLLSKTVILTCFCKPCESIRPMHRVLSHGLHPGRAGHRTMIV